MVEEVIRDILDAEKKAKDILEKADLKAKEIIRKAESDSEKISDDAALSLKKELKEADIKSEDIAEKLYQQIIASGKDDNENIRKKAEPKKGNASDFIVERFISKYDR